MNTRVKTLPYFERIDRMRGGFVVFWLIAAGMAGLAVLLAVLHSATDKLLPTAWQTGFTIVSAALLLPLPFFTLDHLRAQHGVWLGRVAPLSAWRLALADHRRTLFVSWALAALPLVLLRLLAGPGGSTGVDAALSVLWPVALLGALLGMALLLAAALAGLLTWPWGCAAALALLALAVPVMGDAALLRLPAAVNSHQADGLAAGLWAVGLVAMVAVLPFAVHQVHQRLMCPLGAVAAPRGPAPWQRFVQAWSAFNARWRLVDSPVNVGIVLMVLFQLPNQFTSNVDKQFFQAWGSSVSLLHGLRLLVLTALAATLLRGAVLHWRVLLAPGGSVRRHIGLRVVGSTLLSMLLYVGAALGLVVLLWALLPFLPPVPWRSLPGVLISYGTPLLADLALAVALAAWLRAVLGSLLRVGVACFTGALFLGWVVLLLMAASGGGPLSVADAALQAARSELWHRGVAHHAVTFALAALFTLLAQRDWMRVDLFELSRSRKTAQDDLRSW
jgi:hypothetical protein